MYHLWNIFGPVDTLQVWRQKADDLETDFFCQTPPLPSQSLSETLLVRLLPRKSWWSDGFKVPSKCRRPEERVRMMPISLRQDWVTAGGRVWRSPSSSHTNSATCAEKSTILILCALHWVPETLCKDTKRIWCALTHLCKLNACKLFQYIL